jgi:hypothetical protein
MGAVLFAAEAAYLCVSTRPTITMRGPASVAADPSTQIWNPTSSSSGRGKFAGPLLPMSDRVAMVLMVVVTLIALSIIWGTYFRRRPI